MGEISIVGLGPGDVSCMTKQAADAIKNCDVIVGYRVYTDLVRNLYPDKEIIESGMREEVDRCRLCIDLARNGRNVALVCS